PSRSRLSVWATARPAADIGAKRAVSGLVRSEVSTGAVGDLDGEPRGYRRRLDRPKAPPPNDFALEPHPTLGTRRAQLDPHLFVGAERSEGAHVESAGTDVVGTSKSVCVAT